MKWAVLVDNRRSNESHPSLLEDGRVVTDVDKVNRTNDPTLETEHGLSILLETEHHSILLDTGASDMFIRNAERLGKDLSEVDYVFISHGHSDHAGGLKHFMAINDKAKVIVSPDAISGRFFSKRGHQHSITTAWPIIPEERLLTIGETCEIAEGIRVIAHIPQVFPVPKGNQNLFVETYDGSLAPDDFRHELALYLGGLLFTGCAHSGLENILEACPWPVYSVVGGFHLLDHHETEEELKALTTRLIEHYPTTTFHTSHCTGDHVFQMLHDMMTDHLHAFTCGSKIKL